MTDPRELPEWLQLEADQVDAATRREARRTLAWLAAIGLTILIAAACAFRAVLVWLA